MSDGVSSYRYRLTPEEQVELLALVRRARARLDQALLLGLSGWGFVGCGALVADAAGGAMWGAVLGAAVGGLAAWRLRPVAWARRAIARRGTADAEWTVQLWRDHIEVRDATWRRTVERTAISWRVQDGWVVGRAPGSSEPVVVVPERVVGLERLAAPSEAAMPLAAAPDATLRWTFGEPEIRAIVGAATLRLPWAKAAVGIGAVALVGGGGAAMLAGAPWRAAGCLAVGVLLVVLGSAGTWSEWLWKRALRREVGPRSADVGSDGLSVERLGVRDTVSWRGIALVESGPTHLLLDAAGIGRLAIPTAAMPDRDALLARIR